MKGCRPSFSLVGGKCGRTGRGALSACPAAHSRSLVQSRDEPPSPRLPHRYRSTCLQKPPGTVASTTPLRYWRKPIVMTSEFGRLRKTFLPRATFDSTQKSPSPTRRLVCKHATLYNPLLSFLFLSL